MNTSTSLTTPTTPLHGYTVTAGSVLTLGTPADVQPTISAFTRRPRKLFPNDVVRVMKNGQMHLVTVTRVNKWEVHTSDWRCWWIDQPGRNWGDPSSSHASDYMIG